MTSAVIYLDESGDLGWTFDQPYRQGGSSRYLTVAALIVPTAKDHFPKRLIRDLYESRKWSTAKEKKWGQMKPQARLDFCQRAVALRQAHSDISYATITAKKQNVHAHIKADSNKLYNFMIKLLLLDAMSKFEFVTLVPDPRTIKVQSGNSLHDYLQTELWFTKNALTKLSTEPEDSAGCLPLQFADMLAGAVFRYHEDNESAPWNVISQKVVGERLYF